MTVLEALNWANGELKAKHQDTVNGTRIDAPMLDAELLLSQAMGKAKNWLFTHFADLVPEAALSEFRALVERRIAHEPVAYLTGHQDFFNRSFAVNRQVLIPRPETETLVEQALPHSMTSAREHLLFADIGTGSGAIAVTLAAETGIPVIASDISSDALALAKQNAAAHHVEEFIDFREGDLLDPLLDVFRALKKKGQRPFQRLVLCANLPYLTDAQWEQAVPEVKLYEPKIALKAGADGLDAYWKFFRELRRARNLLPTFVTILIEIDPHQAQSIVSLFHHDFPHAPVRILPDLAGKPRVAIAEI